MKTTYTVKPTLVRYANPPYNAPTIEIAVTPEKGEKNTHATLMALAHLKAGALWAQNIADHEIAITNQGDGTVWVTMDVGRDAEDQEKALAFMRGILPAPEKGKVKPQAHAQA